MCASSGVDVTSQFLVDFLASVPQGVGFMVRCYGPDLFMFCG